jgi:hypothetical protein
VKVDLMKEYLKRRKQLLDVLNGTKDLSFLLMEQTMKAKESSSSHLYIWKHLCYLIDTTRPLSDKQLLLTVKHDKLSEITTWKHIRNFTDLCSTTVYLDLL